MSIQTPLRESLPHIHMALFGNSHIFFLRLPYKFD